MTTAVVTNTMKVTMAPRKPADTVDKLDPKQGFDAYSKNSICFIGNKSAIFYHFDKYRIFTPCQYEIRALNYKMYHGHSYLHGTHYHTQTDNCH